MKHEIKFRAWLPEDKIMRKVDKIHLSGRAIETVDHHWDYMALVELMQYAGMHDKNGTDIYDGDIVRSEPTTPGDSDAMIGVVTFLEGSWIINDPRERIAEPLFNETKSMTVIGNVYENPELMEGARNE
ncbi:YopX family protein [Schleiferilactobacillus perolens]|uniref:YopX protein domain-containing protein n=1 Tax=Schleiferilactobacillus perolens DSM 12744 TaxID=1423792 RepID=A0A0R1MS72_9LACO|nr:YopX family protein [Schleiferilactobacillus perolens]KRL10748.1 hypothetical protein FD09_GL000891 [Schleiferilactobacillus perolens DSM 12744]